MKFLVLFMMAFGSKESDTVAEDGTACGEFEDINAEKPIVVKIEEDESIKKRFSSQYIGVSYLKTNLKWGAFRRSKFEQKSVYGGSYDNEESTAKASDTLARKLMKNGEQGHKLNFPDDETEVHLKKKGTSHFIGVSYHKHRSKWSAQRRSKEDNRMIQNGVYEDEEEAAHASDTLARKLMENGEKGHKLNFPDDEILVYKRKASSKYIGVTLHKNNLKWRAQRWSKNENKLLRYGYFDNEEEAAHVSDTLARKLMENGEQGQKLNFPDDDTELNPEEHQKKRKRSENLGNPQDN